MINFKKFLTATIILISTAFLLISSASAEFKQPWIVMEQPVNSDFDPPLAALPPHPPIPTDNPSGTNVWPSKMDPKQELGYMLFFETKLAGDPSLACSDCHDPKQGWSFSSAISKGYPGTVHFRGSQSTVNTGYLNKYFWQASTQSLETQAPSAAHGAQSGNGSDDVMETRLRFVPEYVRRFNEIYGTEWPVIQNAWDAIAAFERWQSQTNTPFDKYMRGDEGALTTKQKQGLELFVGKANCIECHNGPMFTDEKMYNIGVPQSDVYRESGDHQIALRFRSYDKGVTEELYRILKDDLMFYSNTKRKEDMGKVRTPPLRYIEFTAPYFHNGFAFTLEEVIDFYNEGGKENQWTEYAGNKTKFLKPLNLTDDEKEALVEFLIALDDGEIELPVPELPDYEAMPDWQPSKERVAANLLRTRAYTKGE